MVIRCKLCRARIDDPTIRARCKCGWSMDKWCYENHVEWCPSEGEDRWIGATEL